jgi:TRAP-type C4-dicarboxylate transport system permease small subunit
MADRIKRAMNRVLEAVCAIIFAFITLVGSYQIITRYVFNSPSTKSEELLTYSFTWLALLAAALVFGKREHMAMTFLSDKLSDRAHLILSIINEAIVMIFAVLVLIFGGISITQLTATQTTASLGVSMSLIYSVLPVSGVLIIIYNALNLWELFISLKEVR